MDLMALPPQHIDCPKRCLPPIDHPFAALLRPQQTAERLTLDGIPTQTIVTDHKARLRWRFKHFRA